MEFDVNECSTREYAEVFSMEPSVAKGLLEYRTEVVHIFKFEQLLKLKGFADEVLNNLTNPSFDGKVNSSFQESLGLDKTQHEPLAKVLDAVCKKNQATGCFLVARSGEILLKHPEGSSALDAVAKRGSDFLRPIQEQMLLTHSGTGDTFIFSLNNQDIIFLPSGAFYLCGVQPQSSMNEPTINLWRTLSLELKRRYPPKLFINNHASVTESDIAFDCPKCVLRIVVDHHAAGYSFPCPRCKTSVTVPTKTTSFSSYYPKVEG